MLRFFFKPTISFRSIYLCVCVCVCVCVLYCACICTNIYLYVCTCDGEAGIAVTIEKMESVYQVETSDKSSFIHFIPRPMKKV